MVDRAITATVKRYLSGLRQAGIQATQAVVFALYALGREREWSDIDLVVIAPEFDGPRTVELVENLWLVTPQADDRIEPIPCSVREWETDDSRPVLEIARREGVAVSA
jgi:predicted nucleotidyltransferase